MRRVIGVLLLVASAAHADGSLVWKTIETPHFVINYYEPNEPYARRLAVGAEKAHDLLVGPLGHDPDVKTQLVVTDDTDGANGFAQVIPRNQVNVFVSAPEALDVLNDRDDSVYGLIVHEYTHILHLDTVGGVPWLYNQIFGKTWAPNDILPRWFIEGLAVYEESKRSSGGRTRSAIFDGWLRVKILAGEDIGLAALSSSSWIWPHGNIAYLHGSFFMKYLGDRFGDAAIARVTHDYGKQPVPFGLSRALERQTGETIDELWKDFNAAMLARYTLQKQAVEARGLVAGKQLTQTGETNSFPRYSVDGREIWWERSDGWTRPQYRAIASGGALGSDRELAQIDGAGAFSELPDGSGMIIDRSYTYRTVYDFVDLFRYDFATGETTRLTNGARLSGSNVSPDGQWIAAARDGAGQHTIVTMKIDGTGARTVWQGARWDNAYFPVWSPDGTKIAFCAWQQGGDQDIFVLDVATGAATKLTDDRAIDAAPRWSPDGRWVYFTSDRSGIYDVYAVGTDRPGVVKQITNVLGGVMNFDVSPDGTRLVYSSVGPRGADLWELGGVDPEHAPDAELYVDDRPDPKVAADDAVPISKPRAYDPLETLAPLAYTFQLGQDQLGSTLSLGVSGNDVVGWHNYSLALTYGLTRNNVSFGAGYSYNRLWPSFRLAVARATGLAGGLVVNQRRMTYHDEVWTGTAAIGIPALRRPGLSADLSLSYDLDWLRNVDAPVAQDPNAPVPTLPNVGLNAGMTLRASFSTVRRFVFSLGPTEGYSGSIGLRVNAPAFGSDFSGLQLDVRWQQFFKMPWLQHVLWLRYAGGVMGGRRSSYVLGGPVSQDLTQAIVDSARAGSIYFHGYAQIVGPTMQEVNLEYRAPIYVFERGPSTVPIYVNRLHAAAMLDTGNAYSGHFDATQLKVGVGAALRLDLTLGWGVGGTLELGVARGLSQGGETQTWLLVTSGL